MADLSVKEAFERFYKNLDSMAVASLPVSIIIPYLEGGISSRGWFLPFNGGYFNVFDASSCTRYWKSALQGAVFN